MIFSEYVSLLYAAFLEDKGYIETLRKKIKTEEFNRDEMSDPVFQDVTSIDPRRPESYKNRKAKYFPNPFNPESGVYTYEDRIDAKKKLDIIRECLKKGRERRGN
jgi:hypothetical protein